MLTAYEAQFLVIAKTKNTISLMSKKKPVPGVFFFCSYENFLKLLEGVFFLQHPLICERNEREQQNSYFYSHFYVPFLVFEYFFLRCVIWIQSIVPYVIFLCFVYSFMKCLKTRKFMESKKYLSKLHP